MSFSPPIRPWFKARKAAQVAAFFVNENGGQINVLKLVKLIYLADRSFMEQFDCSLLNDQLVSMDHGPVNSLTLSYINGMSWGSSGWDEFITDREKHNVGLVKALTGDSDLDELSHAELRVLSETWAAFGHMSPFQIRDYTHDNCPEWEDPDGSSNPIPYERVFKFLGKENADELAHDIDAERRVEEMFAE